MHTVNKHVMAFTFASATLMSVLQLIMASLTLGLQQTPTSAFIIRRPIAHTRMPPSVPILSASTTSTAVGEAAEVQLAQAYDWDEQLEELKYFMSNYGHCNFPQNPSKKLEKKYPVLKKFCHDQRMHYQTSQRNKGRRMSLQTFDRIIRCRHLQELGFEFNLGKARWYNYYHQLLQYSMDNGHTRVAPTENYTLHRWTSSQRSIGQDGLSPSKIKLLDEIGFEWRENTVWSQRYQELVEFHKDHGHLMMDWNDPLYNWIREQRRKRAGRKGCAVLTAEQIRLLDEIDFPWEPERLDAGWHAKYGELQQFRKKYGDSWPTQGKNSKLYLWSYFQRRKHREGKLSADKIKLLNEIDFPWEGKTDEWPRMFFRLAEYCNAHGHLRVNQEDDPELFDWMDIQRKRYHSTAKKEMLSDEQIERLEDFHFCFALDWKDRTWHEMYSETTEFFKEHGHVRVTKKDNPTLYNWIQIQKKRYEGAKGQKPLSEEELEMLEQIDFAFLEGQPRVTWNTMYTELERYRKENHDQFPLRQKDDRKLNCWIRQQRHRYRCAYGYAPLSDEQKSILESIDFPIYPNGRQRRFWYEKFDALVEFRKQNGHFFAEYRTPLCTWMDLQRSRMNRTKIHTPPFSKLELYLLERIDFPWSSNKLDVHWKSCWKTRYEELVAFVKARGRFPSLSENYKLARWLYQQQQVYKGNTRAELSEYKIQKLDEIGAFDKM